MNVLKLFIASGSELKEEREKVLPVLNQLNKALSHINIEALKWETDLPSGSVPEPRIQGAINPILESCDMVLVLVYSRIGEYTREEYRLAMEKNKKVFVYFKTGFSPKNDKELFNYSHVLKFKKEINKENRVLYKEFDSITMFESLLYQDLNLYISSNYKPDPGAKVPVQGEEKKTKMAIRLTPLPPRTVKFIGREKDLEQLADRLKSENRVLLVQGIGGIGKTELCKAFLWNHMNEYHYTGWIDYLGSLKSSFLRQLQVPGLVLPPEETEEQQFQILNRYLIGLGEEALLVVDNIDNPGDPDLNMLAAYRFKVIANSRCRVEGFFLHEIEFLSAAACKELFYAHYEGKRDPEEEKEVEELIRRAGNHTLTVELLARTASAAGLGVKELNQKLDKVGFDLDGVIKENIRTQWRNDKVKRQFFQHLERVFDLYALSEEEKQFLCNISVLPALPLEIADLKEWLGLESADVLNGLVEKGWLKRIVNRVEMHAVIGEVVRIKEKPGAVKCRKLIESLQWVFHVEPGDNPLEKRDYLAVGESVVQRLDDNDQELATLANNLSQIYLALGQPVRALKLQEKAHKISETVLDKNHQDLAKSYNNLSNIYQDLGQFDRALEFQEKALRIKETVLDRNHPDLARSYNNLSTIYLNLGQPEQALQFQEKALKIRETVLDQNHPDLGRSYNNLSNIYQDLGQFDRALEFQEKAQKIWEAVLDKNHPDLAKSYNNLSMIYKALGQPKRALEFQEKALKICEAGLDKHHPQLARSYNNLSMIYKDLGKLELALGFQEKAHKIFEEMLDKNLPDLASSYNNLSSIYQIIGQLERALEFQEKAHKIWEVVLDKNHPLLAQSYNNLSTIYQALGQPERALEFQEKAHKILGALPNKHHPDLAKSYHNLSTIYQALGQPERALEFQEKAIKIRETVLDKNHPDLALSYYNLSSIYLSMGKFEEALEYQEKALRIIEKSLPENHPFAADSYINLALILKSVGRLDEALDSGKKGVEILKKLLPGDNPRLKSAKEFVGLIRSILGK